MKKQFISWREIFAIHTTNEKVVLEMCMLVQINEKNDKQPNRKTGRIPDQIFQKQES